MNPGEWKVERLLDRSTHRARPFLITVSSDAGQSLWLRSPLPWPGARGNCFVVRQAQPLKEPTVLVEQCRILDVRKVISGAAQTVYVLLDRQQRKRASFLFLRKDGQDMVYFRVPAGIVAHRSRSYLQPSSLRVAHEIVIDTRERYPWALSAEAVTRSALPAGDYALRIEERLVAVVERKSFANALGILNVLESYHGHLSELAQFPAAALVIEAQYADFANPTRTRPMAASRCLRALADIEARHPNLKVVFAGNRKQAALWTAEFFGAVAARSRANDVFEPIQGQLLGSRAHRGGAMQELREAILHALPTAFKKVDAAALAPHLSSRQVSVCLNTLRKQGRLTTRGRGRTATWCRVEPPS